MFDKLQQKYKSKGVYEHYKSYKMDPCRSMVSNDKTEHKPKTQRWPAIPDNPCRTESL